MQHVILRVILVDLTENTAYNNEVIKNHSAEIFQIEHKNNY